MKRQLFQNHQWKTAMYKSLRKEEFKKSGCKLWCVWLWSAIRISAASRLKPDCGRTWDFQKNYSKRNIPFLKIGNKKTPLFQKIYFFIFQKRAFGSLIKSRKRCLVFIRFMFDFYSIYVWLVFDLCSICVRFVFDLCLTFVRFVFDLCSIFSIISILWRIVALYLFFKRYLCFCIGAHLLLISWLKELFSSKK